ncbi:bacillithiol biosynthesis cysteine-adding enzyme BshC [Antarcticibacterium flavum]|uniref:Putative cysteine ligase BshC n=1 Tax=Antarcticibacterium flavum TaxID=2058175 RepID=A0A5B7X6K0_9FLAO|nr:MULTISPECIES: bacillithiol biosynthesis cysteine-adding enzyme BshC [Antarcticibacterium]MCM4159798.1 bacillithiol biosynthesis cysteine-adding enzyme BshC [Antarcticibacterium sp. W02-3]QCY70725.1 bacillithiol biosynthesis cysteine-adding enzyme BshC [Antarcticibacterium flavum]
MPADCLSYKETNYYSRLITDYLEQKDDIKEFYHRFPTIENFGEQMKEKGASFSAEKRKLLEEVLQEQYKGLEVSPAVLGNIKAFKEENTFSITTGHQLNLFTGPLYFLYKIVSAINLASALKKEYPRHHFVPVYWMATEDHDFEEINFFNLNGKKFKWNSSHAGAGKDAVGNLGTTGLEEVYELFSAEIGGGKTAQKLKELFSKAYLQHSNLTEATRYLANELFGEYGLVIIDGDHKKLKTQFIPYLEQELFEQVSHKATEPVAKKLSELGYGVQVNPREINLFYLHAGLRERIIQQEGRYFVNETQISWSKEELREHVQEHPERFSPNVMTRPLYEEVILPNLCYIGGGGELAYWFELKEYFERVKVPFPILLLRNSALIETAKQNEKRRKLDISQAELFLKQHELINRKVRKISNIDVDFSPQKEHLVQQFRGMYELAEKTDKSFLNAVKAQEVKQLKGLENLEKRLLKAQKRKLSDEVTRITLLQNELFPNKGLQERQTNFSEVYLQYGEDLIPQLIEHLNPLDFQFKILTLGEK